MNLFRKKLEFAPTTQLDKLEPELATILRHLAAIMTEPGESEEEWLRHVFVSDEACLAEFLYEDNELIELRERLALSDIGIRHTFVEVASALRNKRTTET